MKSPIGDTLDQNQATSTRKLDLGLKRSELEDHDHETRLTDHYKTMEQENRRQGLGD